MGKKDNFTENSLMFSLSETFSTFFQKSTSYTFSLLSDLGLKLCSSENFPGLSKEQDIKPVLNDHLKTSKYNDSLGLLGINGKNGKKIELDSIWLGNHALISGASGYGKTNLINKLIQGKIASGNSVIYIDPKGDGECLETFLSFCKLYNRKSLVFSQDYAGENKIKINPLKDGDPGQIANRIHSSIDWENQYYAQISYNALVESITKVKEKKKTINFKNIFVEISALIENKIYSESEIMGLLSLFKNISNTRLGKEIDGEDGKSFTELRAENFCIYISLPIMSDRMESMLIGKLILSDLSLEVANSLSYSNRHNSAKYRTSLFIDEFSAIAMPSFIDFFNKCRGSGYEVILAFQTPSDLKKLSTFFWDQIRGNASTFFVGWHPSDTDAIEWAKMFGTFQTYKDTFVIENGDAAEFGSRRDVLQYNVHPNHIKALRKGQFIVFDKNGKNKLTVLNTSFITKDSLEKEVTWASLQEGAASSSNNIQQLKLESNTELGW
jgi:hypothetical protein